VKPDPVQEILEAFGVHAGSIRKPQDAKLASVYIIDDRHVLRSRRLLPDTPARFAAERVRSETVAARTGYAFPEYRTSRDGNAYVVQGGSFWTLHRLIPGRTLGNWYTLHEVDASVDRQVLGTLRRLHESTTGVLPPEANSRTFLPDRVRPLLAEASSFLGEQAMHRLLASFRRVERFCGQYSESEICFVHGDFHHGNLLVDAGEVVGFIDLDWSRAGHALEDLGFTLMMLQRDYATWSPAANPRRREELLSMYRFQGDLSLLDDYVRLYALFDCEVFKNAAFEAAGCSNR